VAMCRPSRAHSLFVLIGSRRFALGYVVAPGGTRSDNAVRAGDEEKRRTHPCCARMGHPRGVAKYDESRSLGRSLRRAGRDDTWRGSGCGGVRRRRKASGPSWCAGARDKEP